MAETMVFNFRPGANQAHIPLKHIKKLGQLVQLGFAQQSTYWSYSDVAASSNCGSIFIRTGHHGAEFVQGEFPAVYAAAFLLEEHRAFGS